MIAYKVKNNKVVAVKCEKMEYPLFDAEDERIYINTHFATREEAYKRAISVCDAEISLAARKIKQLRNDIKELETKLADSAIARINLLIEFKEATP